MSWRGGRAGRRREGSKPGVEAGKIQSDSLVCPPPGQPSKNVVPPRGTHFVLVHCRGWMVEACRETDGKEDEEEGVTLGRMM